MLYVVYFNKQTNTEVSMARLHLHIPNTQVNQNVDDRRTDGRTDKRTSRMNKSFLLSSQNETFYLCA